MGVTVVEVQEPFEAALARVDGGLSWPRGGVTGAGTTWVLPHEPNASSTATHRLLAAGAEVSWATEPIRVGDRHLRHRRHRRATGAAAADDRAGIGAWPGDRGHDACAAGRAPAAASAATGGASTNRGAAIPTLDGPGGCSSSTSCRTRVCARTRCKAPAFGRQFDVLVLPGHTRDAAAPRPAGRRTSCPQHRGGLGRRGGRGAACVRPGRGHDHHARECRAVCRRAPRRAREQRGCQR